MIDYREDANWTVYVHKNKINDKCYVGITSRDPEKRWGSNGINYYGQLFYRAIKKYGWDNFDHMIVAEHLTEDEALNFETTLIEKLDSLINHNGYNVSMGGRHNSGGGYSPIYQFDLHGNYLNAYNAIFLAEQEYDVPTSNIVFCCEGKYSQAGGYVWRYQKDVENPTHFKDDFDDSKFDMYKPVYQFDLEQNFIAEYKSANDACQQFENGQSGGILATCRGTQNKSYGYIWRFKEDVPDIEKFKEEKIDPFAVNYTYEKPVLQFDLEGNFIKEYSKPTQASEATGIRAETIRRACRGATQIGNGYLWRYKEDYHGEKLQYVKPLPSTSKAVLQFDLQGHFLNEFDNSSIAEKETGHKARDIRAVCTGDQKTAHGYIWRYSEYCEQLPDGTYTLGLTTKEAKQNANTN